MTLCIRYNMATLLTNEAKLRYIMEWFQEWSEMEKNDFLDVLIEECGPPNLVHRLSSKMKHLAKIIDDKPTLFQCRIKLFRQWSQNWSQQEKDHLLSSIKNADAAFAQKYDEKILSLSRTEHKKQSDKKET
ncbi:uncharacterized protein C14orf119 isoform X2 [Bombus huntii]|uniref:uncharacterized protein C14orf119 isoform X2 n=1 Tax=Bombus huntii TaxID=85661 RepID=UPI0021A99FE3|nr:uncharacterized protein C14orf119 isoform X2 [Bombus huntii]